MSDSRLLDKLLAEDYPLVAPLQALLDDRARVANDCTGHHETFVVEVGHDHDETLVLLAEQVLDGDLDIVEFNEAGTAGLLATVGDTAVREAFSIRGDHKNGYPAHARFAPVGKDGSSSISSSGYDSSSVPASLSGTVNKPASHQRNQMNLNAVSEQPADESPVMSSRQQLDEREEGASQVERRAAGDEVREDWELSQVARPGTNRISLVDLPSPNELEQATGGRFRFGLRSAAE